MTTKNSAPNLQVTKTWADRVAGVRNEESERLSAQHNAPQETGGKQTNDRIVSPPKFIPKMNPRFEELPVRQPKTPNEITRWEWNSVEFLHMVRTFVLYVEVEIHISQNNVKPPKPQQWKVGFVQNLLMDKLSYKFKESEEKTITLNKKLLDQKPPFEEPWLSSEQHPIEGLTVFDTFDIGSGDRTINLSMNDVPNKGYHNNKAGDRDLGQLERVTNSKSLGLWILARPVDAPAQELNRYVIVSAHQWSLTDSFTVIRGPQRPYHIALPLVDFTAPTYSFDPMDPVREPILTGPTANQYPWEEAREIIG